MFYAVTINLYVCMYVHYIHKNTDRETDRQTDSRTDSRTDIDRHTHRQTGNKTLLQYYKTQFFGL